MPSDQAIIIFVKNPIPGLAKTRLASKIGHPAALEVYEHLVHHTVQEALKTEADIYLYYTDRGGPLFDFEEDDRLNIRFQQGVDLGERMHEAFAQICPEYRNTLLIGSDCPVLTHEHLAETFALLVEEDEVVLGPALDGGYYLIAMKQEQKALFTNMRYSHDKVLQETLDRARQLKLSTHLLEPLRDIDLYEDFIAFVVEFPERPLANLLQKYANGDDIHAP